MLLNVAPEWLLYDPLAAFALKWGESSSNHYIVGPAEASQKGLVA